MKYIVEKINVEIFKNVFLSKTCFNFIHEHVLNLRFNYVTIASNLVTKIFFKIFLYMFEQLKKTNDILIERVFNELEFEKMTTNIHFHFDRLNTTINQHDYEQTRRLKNLVNTKFQTKNLIDKISKIEHDASKTQFLIKIDEKHNIQIFHDMIKIFIYNKINEKITLNASIFKNSSTFFDDV